MNGNEGITPEISGARSASAGLSCWTTLLARTSKMTCEVCGNDPVADARARDRQHEIKHQYRRALYLACGGDKEKVKRMMSRAEDEICQVPPNTVLRPSSNELGEAIEMIERLERVESALRIAVRQNSHDMLLTSDELRLCETALEKSK